MGLQIRWKKELPKRIDIYEWTEIKKKLDEEGITKIEGYGREITSLNKMYGHWFKNDEYHYVCDENGLAKYQIVREDAVDDNVYEYFKTFKKVAEEMNFNKFSNMFGYVSKDYYEMRKCVPTQLSWCKNDKTDLLLEGCYKADVSSAFAYEASKSLPNWSTKKVVAGLVEPNEEYEFAFYSTGGLKIYGELDTEDLYGKYYYNRREIEQRHNAVKEAYDYPTMKLSKMIGYETGTELFTILCKRSKFNLKNVFEFFYDKRKVNEDAKKVMNYFLGMCWKKTSPMYLHIAAVTIARCNKRMIDLAEELVKRGNTPVLIATDSIAWMGKEEKDLVNKEKFLGAFVEEHNNCKMIIKGSKSYQLLSGGKTYTYFSGIKKERTKTWHFGKLLEMKCAEIKIVEMNNGDYWQKELDKNGCVLKEYKL